MKKAYSILLIIEPALSSIIKALFLKLQVINDDYLLLLACKNTVVVLLDNDGWIISEILYIFFYVNRINQWYLSNNESSRHPICFDVVRPKKYLQTLIWL